MCLQDQKGARVGHLSSDIDVEYEQHLEERLLQEQQELDKDRTELEYALLGEEDAVDTNSNQLSAAEVNFSCNRSGVTRSNSHN